MLHKEASIFGYLSYLSERHLLYQICNYIKILFADNQGRRPHIKSSGRDLKLNKVINVYTLFNRIVREFILFNLSNLRK